MLHRVVILLLCSRLLTSSLAPDPSLGPDPFFSSTNPPIPSDPTAPVPVPSNDKVVSITFPADQQADPNSKPCFKFAGHVHFSVSYAVKKADGGETGKLVEFDLPPVSHDMISGSCASPSFTYISSTFRAAEQDFNCRMDINFTLGANGENEPVNKTSPVPATATVRLGKIQLDCDVKEAVDSVKGTFETPLDLYPANYSLRCDSPITVNLSPAIMVTFTDLKLQAFDLPASGEFSPAFHCAADPVAVSPQSEPRTSPGGVTSGTPSLPTPSTDDVGSDVTAKSTNGDARTTSTPVVPQTTKAPTRTSNRDWLNGDVHLLMDKKEGDEANEDHVIVDGAYVAEHGDPALTGRDSTDTTTTDSEDTTTGSTSTSTKSPTTTTGTVTPSVAPNTTTPTTSTLRPTTPAAVTPATVPPNVVPPVGHWTLNRTRGFTVTNETCLILEMSLVMDLTYLAAAPKPNSTVVDYVNKTVRIALPPQPFTKASGSCVDTADGDQLIDGRLGKRQIVTLDFNVTSHAWSLVLEFLDAPRNASNSFYEVLQRSIRDLSPIEGLSGKKNSSNNTVDPEHYVLDTVRLYYDTHSFTDAVNQDVGKLSLSGMKMFQTKDGKATFCNSEQKIVLSPTVSLHTYNFKARPFITNPNQTYFGEAQECEADRLTSDIVPIAVGCALAALIVVVLVAYAIGRHRRRRQGYQTVE